MPTSAPTVTTIVAPIPHTTPAQAHAAFPTDTREDTLRILELSDDKLPALIDAAFALRHAHKGLRVGVQLLTNARSGNCSQNCAYCAQSGTKNFWPTTPSCVTTIWSAIASACQAWPLPIRRLTT